LEATPAGHAGAIREFLRQLLPGDPGTQHEQDAGEGATVIDSFPTGMVEASFRTGKSGSISFQSSSSSGAVAIEDLLF
jgi:hypothetical protein